jgi:transposase
MAKLKLVKHVSYEELVEMYRNEKDRETKERLLAIKLYYEGYKDYEIARILDRDESTIRKWKKRWNERGYEGLKTQRKGGRKPKLSREEWEKIAEKAVEEGMDLKEVVVYVKKEYGVEYSYTGVWKNIRKILKVKYGKPYVLDKRKPENAEEILKKDWKKGERS